MRRLISPGEYKKLEAMTRSKDVLAPAVVLYARVSTRDKDQTPDTQLHALREYADAHGWQILREYVDQASAGDLRGRTAWRQMVTDVRQRPFDLLLVTKLDRAFRSVKETYDTLAFLSDHNSGFVATTQPIDTSTATGKLLLGVLAAVAEFERELIRERVKEGMARAKADGTHVGRPKGSTDTKRRRRSGYFLRYAE